MAERCNSVLYIAYHYPPILGSSGVHRTLAFTRFLAEQGWRTQVLTASVKAYDRWQQEQYKFIPDDIKVIRAFARNTAKQLSIKGKYLSWMALPDNWQSWILGGFVSGLAAIIKDKPQVIVSTYPIASAHIIAYLLHKVTGIPWVADFRDPMAQADYPTDKTKKKIFQWIERKVVKHCQYVILTAPGAKAFYQDKFPQVAESFWQVIPNGFDQAIFDDLASTVTAAPSGKLILLHSGVIYPYERDPSHLFQALAELKQENVIDSSTFQLVLRASGHDHLFEPKIEQLQLTDIVELAPPVAYEQALNEMLGVDALLLLQADNCDYQIPAKAYEYIKAQKPVLALTSANGDTGKLLTQAGLSCLAPLNDKDKIKAAIGEFIRRVEQDDFTYLAPDEIHRYSRQFHAERFAELLSSVIDGQ